MRSSLIGLIAAAAAFAGCSKVSGDDLMPIRFSGATVTKALVSDATGMQSRISLYGFEKEPGGQEAVIFGNVPLSYLSSKSEWSYPGNIRYWIPDNRYTFIGLYPGEAEKYSNTGMSISFSHTITPYSHGDQQDLMAGCHYREFTRGGDASAVVLPMRHLLSAVEFKIQNACTSGTLDISNISLTGLYTAGDCTLTPKPGESDFTATWSPTGEPTGEESTHYNGDKAISALAVGPANAQDAFQEMLLVIPQDTDLESIKFRMTVDPSTVTGPSDAYDKVLSIADATNITAWEPGKKYTYIASVSSERITFQILVHDWIEDEEHILK